jgi:hypothetical protein
MKEITIVDVFRSMGIEPNKRYTWEIGAQLQRIYFQEHGHQPPKDNRPKTGGGGSHCFALYPANYFDRIASMIRESGAEKSLQSSLWE